MVERRVTGTQSVLGNNALSILGRARAERQETIGTLSQSNTRFAELSAQITQAQTQSNTAAAESAAAVARTAGVRRSQVAQDMAVVAETLGTLGKSFTRNIEAEQEALRTREFSQAFIQMQNLSARAPELIYGTSPEQYEKQVLETIGSYAHITGEDVQQLANVGYGALRAVNSQRHQRLLTDMDNLRKGITSQKSAELELKLAGTLSGIENTYQDATPLIERALGITNEFLQANPDIDPSAAIQIHTNILNELKDKVGVNFQQRQEISNQLAGLQQFQNEVAPWFAQMRSGEISPNLYQAKVAEIAIATGVPLNLAGEVGDPFMAENMALQMNQRQQQLEELHQRGIAKDIDKQLLTTKNIGIITSTLLSPEGATFRAEIESNPEIAELPAFQTALRLAGDYEDFLRFRSNTRQEITSINKQITDFQAATQRYVLDRTTDAQQFGTFIQRFKTMFPESPVAPTPPGDPTANLEEWMTWREESLRFMQQRAQEKGNELRRRSERFQPYQLDRPLEQIQQEATGLWQQIREASRQQPRGGFTSGQQPNFNQGVPQDNTAFATVSDKGGRTLFAPVRAQDAGKIYVSSHYNEDRGNRKHKGLDIAAPAGTPIISPVRGEIVVAKWGNAYGNYIDVKDADTGQIHRFAHMPSLDVKVGQKVGRGDQIGKVGNTGRSTGAHIHWELRTSSTGRGENTRDIMEWAVNQNQNPPRQRGDNREWYRNSVNPYTTDPDEYDVTADTTIPAAAMPMKASTYLLNNRVFGLAEGQDGGVQADQVIKKSRPYKQSFVPSGKADFIPAVDNAPGQNFGYAKLARNPQWADKIGEIATRLGIPAIWLADVIAFESGFSHTIDNGYDDDGDGHGYVGLIQIGARAAKDLGLTIPQIKRMSFNEYMEKVTYPYLARQKGRLTSVESVLGYIFGGRGLLDKLDSNRSAAFRRGDINISFGNYLKRLGRDAGRQYEIKGLNDRRNRVSNVIHEKVVAGCPVCNDMLRSSSQILPHELA